MTHFWRVANAPRGGDSRHVRHYGLAGGFRESPVLTSYPPVRVAGDSDANLKTGFRLLPGWPRRRVLQLAPAYWKQTSDDADAQRRLAANPFRAATLALER